MKQLAWSILSMLLICSVHAQTSAAEPPQEEGSLLGVIIFFVLFVGTCVGFGAWWWWKSKDKDTES